MIRSLAVTTDLSEASREAFGPAAGLCRTFGVPLRLIHVVEPPQDPRPWQGIRLESPFAARRRRKRALERLAEEAAREPLREVKVEPVALHGEPAEEVARYMKKKEVDLLVIATHGLTGVARFPLGSETLKVLRLAPCPVLVIRQRGEDLRAAQPFRPSRLLAPHDFSSFSTFGLEAAWEWAEAFGASLEVLVVVTPARDLYGLPRRRGLEVEETRRTQGEARERLEALLKSLRRERGGPAAVEGSVRAGNPAVEILEEIERLPADLVVISSRGLTTDLGRILGSIGERVINEAPCPVLIVHGRVRRASRGRRRGGAGS